MSNGGKGSARRPGEGFQEGWDRIFSGKKTHWFVADSEGQYICKVCGKNKQYAQWVEECPGTPVEVEK